MIGSVPPARKGAWKTGIPSFLCSTFEEDSLIPFFGKNQSGDIWAYAIVHGPELATSPSSFHLSLVIFLLCMDLARIIDDFSRPLYSWRTPVLGPPDFVANLAESGKLPSPLLRRSFNLPLLPHSRFHFRRPLKWIIFLLYVWH